MFPTWVSSRFRGRGLRGHTARVWRGMLRIVVRGLRHGLVVAGVCLGIAVVTGLSGYFFTDHPGATRSMAAAPPRDGASTSTAVLERWVKTPPALRIGDIVPGGQGGAAVALVAPGAVGNVALASRRAQPVVVPAPDSTRTEFVQRVSGVSAIVPKLATGDRPVVTLSFYYCEEAPGDYTQGDGGGFCGKVRDGSMVRSGVAACDVAYLGQRFRIEGDPTGRSYVCADTGSAVHGLHRDIWFLDNRDGWSWQRQTGTVVVIEILP